MKSIAIIGNLTRDCKIYEGEGGQSQSATFSVAVGDRLKRDAPATYFGCRTYQQGVFPYLKKGKKVYLQGDFYTSQGTNNEGQAVTYLNVNVKNLELLGGRDDNKSQEDNAFNEYNRTRNDMDDEIPF